MDKINREKHASITSLESSKGSAEIKDNAQTLENFYQKSVMKEEQQNIENDQKLVNESVDELINVALMEEVSNVELNYDTIYNLVYNREYIKAYNLIERFEERGYLARLCYVTVRLIKQIEELKQGILNNQTATIPTGDKFKDFYQALRNCDYEYAYIIADEFACSNRDFKEFELYKLLLEDLKELSSNLRLEIVEKEQKKAEIKVLFNKIKEKSCQKDLTKEDILELIEVLKNKIELEYSVDMTSDCDEKLLNLAEMTLYSMEYAFNYNNFARMKGRHTHNIGVVFNQALELGDYPTCREIISSISWKEIGDLYDLSYIKLMDKLSNIMFKNVHTIVDYTKERDKITEELVTKEMLSEVHRLAYELLTEKERIVHDKIGFLREMRSLVKKSYYEKAYQKYLAMDVDYKDPEVMGNLVLIRSILQSNASDL